MMLTRTLTRLFAAWLAPTILLAALVVAGAATPAAASAGCEIQQSSPSCSLFAGVGPLCQPWFGQFATGNV